MCRQPVNAYVIDNDTEFAEPRYSCNAHTLNCANENFRNGYSCWSIRKIRGLPRKSAVSGPAKVAQSAVKA